MMLKTPKMLMLGCAVLAISACQTPLFWAGTIVGIGQSDKIFAQKTNYKEKNYATADYLYQQAADFIERDDLMIVEPLTDTAQVGMSSTLGRLIPEQVGVRLSQLGIRIDLSQVQTTPEVNYLKPSITKGEKPDFVLTGSFTRNDDVDVSMRIIDLNRDRIVATFDYQLPSNSDTRELAQPQPKIIRMTDEQ